MVVDIPRVAVLGPAEADGLRRSAITGAAGLVILAGLLLVWRRLLVRARGLQDAAARWTEGDWTHRVAFVGDDELGRLGASFNLMAARLGLAVRERDEALARAQDGEHQSHGAAVALRASEERYRSLVEVSPDGIFLQADRRPSANTAVDPDDTRGLASHLELLYANPAALRIFGATDPAQMLGRNTMEFALPASKEHYAIVERIAVMEAGTVDPSPRERMCVRLDGTEFLLEVSTTSVTHEGRPAFLSVFRDITERRRAEDALSISEANYRRLVELSPDGVLVRQDGCFVYANSAAVRLFRASKAEQILGRRPEDLIHSLDREALAENGAGAYDSATPREQRVVRLDGTEFLMEAVAAEVVHNGRPAMLLLIRDITDRHLAEEALRQQAALLDLAPVAIIARGIDARVTYWNAGAEMLYGWSGQEARSQVKYELLQTTFPELLEVIERTLMDQGAWNGELRHRRRDGQELTVASLRLLERAPGEIVGQSAFDVYGDDHVLLEQLRRGLGGEASTVTNQIREFAFETYCSPIWDVQGTVAGVTGFAVEISEREAMERLKDSFVAMVSHELRTPMNGVIGMTDLLLESHLTPVQRDYVETIRDSGASLVTIVNDIPDFSRLQAGEVKLELIDLDVRVLVGRVVELLVGAARAKGRRLVSGIDRGVPLRLCGDPARLRQVLVNLVSNAIKFTSTGEVTLQVRSFDDDAGQVVLRCDIVDTGVGIRDAALEHLFEPFHQADSSIARQFGGTGLGLAICKRLVEAMGGEVGVASEPGVGNTFWFSAQLEHSATRLSQSSIRGLRVLVIDTHAVRAAGVCELLAAWGVAVEVNASPRGMLEELERLPSGDRKVVVLLHLPLAEIGLSELLGRVNAMRFSESVALKVTRKCCPVCDSNKVQRSSS